MALTLIEKRSPLSLRIWSRGEQDHISAVEFQLIDEDRHLEKATGKMSNANAFCSAMALSYPDTDRDRLRICAEQITVLSVWDGLLDVPIESDIAFDGQGARGLNRVMSCILTQPENSEPIVTQPVPEALHS